MAFVATVLGILGAGGCASVPVSVPLRVGIVGDQTLAGSLDDAYLTLDNAVTRLNAERVAVVLHTGDLVESTEPTESYRAAFQRASTILGRLTVPWYMAAGDHDVAPPPPFVQDSSDRSREALFKELYGTLRPEAKDRLYYSFDVQEYHFVALYSSEVLNADPRWGAILLAGLSDAQRRWLVEDLERHGTARATVIFLHQPLWYNWTSWAEIHEVLRRFNVRAVVAGHFHYNQDEGVVDGIRYVVVGAAGGVVKNGAAGAGNLHHVTVMTLAGRSVDFEILPLNGESANTLTPRVDMDRVQMLDVALGDTWDFASRNKVFLKNGALVGSCENAQPARIEVVHIGNPLDVPITVTIRFKSEGVTLGEPHFDADACGGSGNRCILRRGARIGVANLSSVEMAYGVPPLWSAMPVVAGPTGSAPGTALALDIRLAFDGKSGPLWLEKRLTTIVQTCP